MDTRANTLALFSQRLYSTENEITGDTLANNDSVVTILGSTSKHYMQG